MNQSKTCTTCGQIKPLSDYHAASDGKYGVSAKCKDCKRLARQLHRQVNHEAILAKEAAERRANPDGYRSRARKSYAKHSETRRASARESYDPIKQKIRAAKYRLENPEQVVASNAKWSANNKEKKSQLGKEWRSLNADKTRNYSAARRALLANNGVFSITPKEIRNLLSMPCFYCGDIYDIQLDHVMPVKRGGKHSIGNLVAACGYCNRSKKDRTITEWNKFKTATLRYLSERGK